MGAAFGNGMPDLACLKANHCICLEPGLAEGFINFLASSCVAGLHIGSAFSGVISMKCPRYCFVVSITNPHQVTQAITGLGETETVCQQHIFAFLQHSKSLIVPEGRVEKAAGQLNENVAQSPLVRMT